jgi:histidinol phosphatase-like enzyme (inositol monophosphatase family)
MTHSQSSVDQSVAAAIDARLQLAIRIARAAGEFTLRYFGTNELAVERKADASPVTVADRGAELLIREEISAAFPDDAILGEEFPEKPGASGFRWILDPIDGTKSFISGVPLYGTLIGVERGEESVIGVIEMPVLDERAWAARGSGAWYARGANAPVPARVSYKATLGEGLFVVSQVDSFAKHGRGEAFLKLQAAAGITRTWGDCYGYLLVATGRAEAMVDPIMSTWDAGAMLPILVEAGGTFTDWTGKPTIHSSEGIATNGRVFDEVMRLI